MVSIFLRPTAGRGDAARRFVPDLPDDLWDAPAGASRAASVARDPSVEATLALASLHYLRRDYDAALEVLDRLDAASTRGTIHPVSVACCRAEVLLVAGRARAAAECLARVEGTLPRAWLARAYVECGETAAADEVFRALDQAALHDELNLLQYAWHAAFAGDFERCERLFEQLLTNSSIVRHTPYEHWPGYALTATGLAADGDGAERASAWSAGLLDRLGAKAAAR